MRRRDPPRRRGRTFLLVERVALGAGMSMVAFVLERRLIKAIKKGRVEAAPRTAAGGDAEELPPSAGLLSTSSHEVGDQPGRQ